MAFDLTWTAARKRARVDFWWFCRFVLGDEFFNGNAAAIENDLHRDLCGFISRPRSNQKPVSCVIAPRGHLKSMIANEAHDIYLLANDPSERILLCHGIDETATKMVGNIRIQMATNERLMWLYPDVFWRDPDKEARTWCDSALSVKRPWEDNVPSITASGMDGTKAGLHYTRIKDDDLTNDQNCNNHDQVTKSIDTLERHMNLLRDEKSRLDFICTIWSYYDASWWLTAKENAMSRLTLTFQRGCWKNPDAADEDLEPIWPQVKTKQFLMNQRATKPVLFAQQQLCRRVLSGATVFSESDIQRFDLEWEDWGGGKLQYVLPDSTEPLRTEPDREWRNYCVWMAIDLNNKQTERSDFCVMTVGAKDDRGHLWLIKMRRGRPDPAEQLVWVRELVTEFQPESIILETVGYQYSFKSILYEDTKKTGVNYPIVEENRGNKMSKPVRIRLMQQPISVGMLHVPTSKEFDPLIEEVRGYIGADKDRDDCLDTVADLFARVPVPPKINRRGERATHLTYGKEDWTSKMIGLDGNPTRDGVPFTRFAGRRTMERSRR